MPVSTGPTLKEAMILKPIFEESLAQAAYLIGCPSTGEALVLDPTIDIERYLDAAAAEGLRITGVAETHIHADFVSGARALALATGAELYVSGEGGPDWQYAFAHAPGVRLLHDGDTIAVGRIRLEAVHTPGHTPEHLMFVATDTSASGEPRVFFTGDFLFVSDIGRPDLLETAAGYTGTMEASARRLFSSIHRVRPYPGHIVIWPGHGAGSACGKSPAGVPASSLGYERLSNWALREDDEEAFVRAVLADQPDPPMYFAEMKRINKDGAPAWRSAPGLSPFDASELRRWVDAERLLIDARTDLDWFARGSVTIPPGRNFATWAGSVIPPTDPFVIVAADESGAADARRALAVVGRTAAAGWISPGTLERYRNGGGEIETIATRADVREGEVLIDVRSSSEWSAGHLDGAIHVPLARLPERTDGLNRDADVLVYCQSGRRAAVAVTALRRAGFRQVASLEGGLSGYTQRQESRATVA
jgi:hydroxyacylglutathione hydrolase